MATGTLLLLFFIFSLFIFSLFYFLFIIIICLSVRLSHISTAPAAARRTAFSRKCEQCRVVR